MTHADRLKCFNLSQNGEIRGDLYSLCFPLFFVFYKRNTCNPSKHYACILTLGVTVLPGQEVVLMSQ